MKVNLKKVDKDSIRDIINRASKTFIQAFLGSVVVENFTTVKDVDGLKTVLYSTLLAGVAAGISAVLNIFLNSLDKE